MKTPYLKWLFAIVFLISPWIGVHAQDRPAPEQHNFVITEGKVTITQVFCIPEQCEEQQGTFSGSFTATLNGDQIALSNIAVKSDVPFTLPADPHTDRDGAVYDANFSFDGRVLILEGIINSSAFDGPIVNYSLVAEIDVVSPIGFDQNGYFLARQDFRKCAAPLCGGIFVKHVNHKRLQCPDGRFRSECYIGTPDWSKIGFNPFTAVPSEDFNTSLLLKGTTDYSVELGRFWAEKAFYPAGTRAPTGTFFAAENNGIVCITSPCFSFDQYTLNSKKPVAKISDLDLTQTGASEEEIASAYAIMAEGEPVLIAGVNRKVRQLAGVGVKLVASQFYLPVKGVQPGECKEGYKPGVNGCATANGCVFPLLELAVYGGARPDDGVEAPSAPISYECVDACEEPAVPVSNGYCALFLP